MICSAPVAREGNCRALAPGGWLHWPDRVGQCNQPAWELLAANGGRDGWGSVRDCR